MKTFEELIKEFEYPVQNTRKAISQYKSESDKKIIGCLPIYVPEELIWASGAIPIGIWGGNVQPVHVNEYLQVFACSVSRNIYELKLSGAYDMVDGFVISSNTCDTIKVMLDIWLHLYKDENIYALVNPTNPFEGKKDYAKDRLNELKSWLEKLTGQTVTEDRLKEANILYNKHRSALRRFYELCATKPGVVTAMQRNSIVKSAFLMPKDKHLVLLEQLNKLLANKSANDNSKGIFITGIMAEPIKILQEMDDLGFSIIGDDLAMGNRQFRHDVPVEMPDQIEALAVKWEKMGPCSTILSNEDRGKYIVDYVNKYDAKGIVVIMMKSCEPEEFDYPLLKKGFEDAGVTHAYFEIEQGQESISQIKTILQAYSEQLA